MKNLPNKIFVVVCILGLLYCSPENETTNIPEKGSLQFSFSLENNSGGRITDEVILPDIVYAVISIENDVGDLVIDSKKIELFKLNDDYITTPIALVSSQASSFG